MVGNVMSKLYVVGHDGLLRLFATSHAAQRRSDSLAPQECGRLEPVVRYTSTVPRQVFKGHQSVEMVDRNPRYSFGLRASNRH
jgi:hypothetical protein